MIPPESKGGTSCNYISRLTDYLTLKVGSDDIAIFSTWATIDDMYDFRDQVLKKSRNGEACWICTTSTRSVLQK